MVEIDHTSRAHARISASKVHRVIQCPGSLQAEEKFPYEPGGAAAERGTRIHELSEHMLLGTDLPADAEPDLIEVAKGYVAEVARATESSKKRYIELSVTEALQGIHPDLGGTADLVAVGGGTLLVADLKTGRIPVDPTWNEQLMTYALGAAFALKAPTRVAIRLAIYQPDAGGWKEWHCTYQDLLDWKAKLAEAATLANAENPPLRPSPDACQYCRARVTCPAIRGAAKTAALVEFDVQQEQITPAMLDDAELASAWADSVFAAAKLLLKDKPDAIAGWKLAPGRKMQKWATGAAAQLADRADCFDLKTPAQVRKLLGDSMPDGLIVESNAEPSLKRS